MKRRYESQLTGYLGQRMDWRRPSAQIGSSMYGRFRVGNHFFVLNKFADRRQLGGAKIDHLAIPLDVFTRSWAFATGKAPAAPVVTKY